MFKKKIETEQQIQPDLSNNSCSILVLGFHNLFRKLYTIYFSKDSSKSLYKIRFLLFLHLTALKGLSGKIYFQKMLKPLYLMRVVPVLLGSVRLIQLKLVRRFQW